MFVILFQLRNFRLQPLPRNFPRLAEKILLVLQLSVAVARGGISQRRDFILRFIYVGRYNVI